MKHTFIRVLFGDYSQNIIGNYRFSQRRRKIETDIENCIHLTEKHGWGKNSFMVYVFGEKNYDILQKLQLNCTLIHPEPFKYTIKHIYKHKVTAMKYAMENQGYDEIIFLDWDCCPIKPFNENFWENIRNNGKKDIQAPLYRYKAPKCPWRPNTRKTRGFVPNGGFVYIRDKTIPSKIMEIWENNDLLKNQENDEPVYAYYTDSISNGWQGTQFYQKNFSPDICLLGPGKAGDSSPIIFRHYGDWKSWEQNGEL